MPIYAIEGTLLHSFNIAWETPNPIDLTYKSISLEVQYVLEEKLLDLIKPHEKYAVSVVITKLDNEDGEKA